MNLMIIRTFDDSERIGIIPMLIALFQNRCIKNYSYQEIFL